MTDATAPATAAPATDAPGARPRADGFDAGLLLAGLVGFALIYAATYPRLSGIEDEVGFVNQAVFWSRGAVSAEGAGLSPELGDLVEVRGRHLPARHPGRSLVALPFVAAGGVPAAFGSGLLLQAAIVLVGAATLKKLGASPAWALLLLHPTLSLYSRTIMADAASGLGLLISAWAIAGPRPASRGARAREAIIAGLGVSVSAAMRYHGAIALPIVALAVAWRGGWRRPDWASAVACALGSAAGALPIVAFNLAVYGRLTDPYTAGRGHFDAAAVPQNLAFYLATMALLWPGMVVAPLLDRSRVRVLSRGVCGFYFASACAYYFHDRGASPVETAVVGLRLMQVALPIWIVSYATILDGLARRLLARVPAAARLARPVAAAALLGLLAGTGLLFQRHQAHLGRLAAKRDAMAAVVPPGSTVIAAGDLVKLFGIARPDVPVYDFRDPAHLLGAGRLAGLVAEAGRSGQPIYLAFSPKFVGGEPPREFTEVASRLDARPVEVRSAGVRVLRAEPSR